tara:strand:- start:1363 stop:2307 length:945 start_codon:yes stop_codon:yes gene_type:complete
MRKSLYFSKPQPLSPKSKTWVEGNTRYRKNKTAKGGKTSVKGVPTTDSIYYLWFEYLKRSEKYKTACANNGKGMSKLYKDFGNVFEYEGVEGFWSWWNERGQYLFGIEGKQEIVEFDNADEVVGYEDYKLIAIPKNITATTIKKRLNKLVDDMELNPTAEQTAKYSIAQTKVDVESLETCLMAYDLKQQGKGILEIGLQVKWIGSAEAKDLIEDNRRKGKEVDLEKLAELSEKNRKEYGRLLTKAQAIVSKRLKDKYIDTDYEDDLIDKEMKIFKRDYVRTARKKSIQTNTHKLIKKAKANIHAVENGAFGVGH